MSSTRVPLLLALAALSAASSPAASQTLTEPLRFLEPLLGRDWTGMMTAPDGSAQWRTTRRFERMWDGSVVKFTSATPDVGSAAEGYLYWDREAGRVAVLVVNGRGVYQRGSAALEDGIVSIRGVISFPERSFEFRNTFDLRPDGRLVDRWFQNAFGSWRPGHVVELTAAPTREDE